jgi:WD40 repeat protein
MSDETINPYVGPRTFEEKDSEFFFGRERESDDLLSLIIAEPLVLFYAQSGAGKSSLLNARVIPGLRDEAFTVLPVGRVGGTLPEGIEQIDNVFAFNLLLSLDQGKHGTSQLARMTLPDYLKQVRAMLEEAAGPDEEVAIALVIDQFEEIITSNLPRWTEREAFFLQMRQAMKNDPLLWIVLTLREDYVAALDPFALMMPDRMRARYYMKRMDAKVAKAAIEKPAANHGRPFANGVAGMLVNNLRQIRRQDKTKTQVGEYVEPVQLQVVCYQLWQNLKARPLAEITQEDLDELGDVDIALSQFYEQAICDVLEETGGSESTVRYWFERQLITEAETRGTVYQGATDTAGLPNEIVRKLEDHFLLRAEIRAGATWYELVHDRFVGPILQANQVWRMQQSPLIQAAEAWDRAGRSRDLLYEGKQLSDVLATVTRETAEPLVQAFVSASEDAQSQRDLESAREQATEERKRADAQTRTARILRALAVALLIVFLIAVAAAFSAIRQGGIAEQNAQEAQVQAQNADTARATAEASAIVAEEARSLAEVSEQSALAARQDAEENADAAEAAKALAEQNELAAVASAQEAEDAQALAEENEDQAEQARASAEANALEAERLKQVAIAQSLAALAPQIITRSNDTELAILLALESLRINESVNGGLQGLIDSSLRGILSLPYFNTTFDLHESRVVSVALSPDTLTMASADAEGVVRIWDLASRVGASFALTEEAGIVRSLRFSEDGQRLSYIENEAQVHIWDLSVSDPILISSIDHTTSVRHYAFGPGQQIFTTTTADNEVIQWCLTQTPPAIISRVRRTGSNQIVGLSPDGAILVTADANNTINFWDLTIPGAPRSLFLIGHADPVNTVAFSPDGSTFASADVGGQIRIWDLTLAAPFPTRLFTLRSGVAKMVISEDGLTMASVSTDRTDLQVRLWDLDEPGEPPATLAGHGSTIEDIALGIRGLQLASASSDRTIRLWNLSTPVGLPITLAGSEGAIDSVAFEPADGSIVSGGTDGFIRRWTTSGQIKSTIPSGHKGGITSIALSSDFSTLATSSDDGTVRLWDVGTLDDNEAGEPMALIEGHEDGISDVAFSPDGKYLATASDDASIRLWLWQEALFAEERSNPIAVLEGDEGKALSVAFSPNGLMLASGHDSSAVLLWDVGEIVSDPSSGPKQRLSGHEGAVLSVTFSPDGQLLASAGNDLDILLWRLDISERGPISLTGHDDWVFSVAFSPDGRELASASLDQTIRLWDITDLSDREQDTDNELREPTTLTGHSSVVQDVVFSSDGSMLASASEDKTVQLWLVEADLFVSLACQQIRRNMTWEEWVLNVSDALYQLTCVDLPVHPSFIGATRDLAEDGDVTAALLGFERALELDPTLDLEPLAETAEALVEGGVDLAQDGEIESAMDFFTRAQQLVPSVSISAEQWHTLCLAGAKGGQAVIVVEACENAVEMAVVDGGVALNQELCQIGAAEELAVTMAPSCEQAANLAASTADGYLNYRLCLQSVTPALAEALSAACQRAAELTGEIAFGEVVTGVVQTGLISLWAFEGTEGQVVTIGMSAADGEDLDAFVALLDPYGVELIFNDDAGETSDSLIEDYSLPTTGTYVILAQGYRESSGPFRLSLSEGS